MGGIGDEDWGVKGEEGGRLDVGEGRGGGVDVLDVLFALKCDFVYGEELRSEWMRVCISILPLLCLSHSSSIPFPIPSPILSPSIPHSGSKPKKQEHSTVIKT